MREAAKHYHENLSAPRGKNARDYLEARGITGNLVTRFGFGASFDGEEIITYLLSKGYTRAEMKEAGLVEQRGADWFTRRKSNGSAAPTLKRESRRVKG